MKKGIVKISDCEIKYCFFGNGKDVLIVIPGIYLKSVVDSADALEDTFSYLTDKYTIYLFDRRKTLKDNETIKEMTDDLIEAFKELKITKCDVYAASQGAIIAEYIAINTNIINKMLLASSVIRIDDYTKDVFIKLLEVIKTNNRENIISEFINNVYSKETLDSYKDYLIDTNKDMDANDIHNLEVMCKAMNTSVDNISKLKNKNIKTFVVGSKRDKIFKTNAIEELMNDLNASGYFYDNYGHGVYDEAKSFQDLMRSFFLDNQNFF